MFRFSKVIKRFALVVLLGLTSVLVGCSTIHGVGQDVEYLGERIQQGLD